jgi:hypothetical protein
VHTTRILRDISIAFATAAVVATGFWMTSPVESQAARPARIAGKPNLNGIWQALNTANYDILSHQAKAALAFRPGPVVPVPAAPVLAFGAVGAVPAELARSRSGDQVLPAGRAARDLHADAVPDPAQRQGGVHRV